MKAQTKLKWSSRDLWVLLAVLLVLLTLGLRVALLLHYRWNWQAVSGSLLFKQQGRWTFGPLLLGMAVTIKLAFYSLLFALPLGTGAALLHRCPLLLLRWLGQAYVQLIRNLPPLVLVLVCYYLFADRLLNSLGLEQTLRALPEGGQALVSALFYRVSLIGSFFTAVLVLALYQGAYVCEIVRGGLLAIPRTQHLAGKALGLSSGQLIRFVLLPQVWRKVLPPLAGQFVSAIKDSSIVSAISVAELTLQGNQLMSSTLAFFEVSLLVFLLYFLLTFSCAQFFEHLFRRQGSAHLN